MEVFNKDPAIKVVSNQAANWDANTALNITATVIQQHPDLCASVGFWGIMQSGAAQAIRNAGKIDDVKVYASGEGSQLDCDQVNQGNFYRFLSYKATEQGHDLMFAAETLLESGEKPGTKTSRILHPPGLARQSQRQRRQLLRATQEVAARDPVRPATRGPALRLEHVRKSGVRFRKDHAHNASIDDVDVDDDGFSCPPRSGASRRACCCPNCC